jgi:hypothetical protein
MYNRVLWAFWALLTLGATIAGIQAQDVWGENIWLVPALVLMWIITLVGFFRWSRVQKIVGAVLRPLRRWPALLWLVLLVYICVTIGAWLALYQPTYGRPLKPVEFCYLCVITWGFIFLLAYNINRETLREMGQKLSKSWLAGLMITLTTIVLIFAGAEAYLRIAYITTDGYGFTAMNYHWYNNFYWNHLNSLGYRDYEPRPDDPNNPFKRVMVVGDSFTAGHGIDNLDDTFPQVLERELGDGYDVNLVAKSGWDMIDYEAWLNNYPLKPDIVVLSYYLNDIDYLMEGDSNPNNNFVFPTDPNINWFVLNFFTPNFVYYNLLQFTSSNRTNNFQMSLVDAHLDANLWSQETPRIDSFVQWNKDHETRLIVLVWPMIRAVDASVPATAKVKAYFEELGAEVVDMTDILKGKNSAEMVVNRYDAHPSIAADKLAADALYNAIMNPPQTEPNPP